MTLEIRIGAWTICLHVYRLYMLMKYVLSLGNPPPPKKKYNNTIKKTNKIKKTRIRLKKSIEIDTKKKRFSKYCGTMKKGLQCSPKT